jgi:hypothetical protein
MGLWFVVGQVLRYLLIVFPALALLAAWNVETFWRNSPHRRWVSLQSVILLVLALLYVGATRGVTTVQGWYIPERYPYRVALGLETREQFLSRVLTVYDALQYLNRQGDGKHKVLSIGNEFRLYTASRIWTGGISSGANLAPPGPALAAAIAERGFDFLLVNQMQIKANPDQYRFPVLDEKFLAQFARLEFANNNVYVYRLLPATAAADLPKVENLMWNSGFEGIDERGVPNGWFAYGTPVVDNSGARAHSGQVAVMSSGNAGLYQRIVVQPGALYTLEHWTRADRLNQFARLQINWLNERNKIVGVSIDLVPAGAEWQRHQMSATAPADATLAQVYASVHENSEVWFDDYEFSQVSSK